MTKIQTIRQSPTYQAARAGGYGVTDAVAQMRAAAAFRASAISSVQQAQASLRRPPRA